MIGPALCLSNSSRPVFSSFSPASFSSCYNSRPPRETLTARLRLCTMVFNWPPAKASWDRSENVHGEKPSVLFLTLMLKYYLVLIKLLQHKLISIAAAKTRTPFLFPVNSCWCYSLKVSWLVMESLENKRLIENTFSQRLARWMSAISELKSEKWKWNLHGQDQPSCSNNMEGLTGNTLLLKQELQRRTVH